MRLKKTLEGELMKRAIIWGTGTQFLVDEDERGFDVETSYGVVTLYEKENYYLLLRHMKAHKVLPHMINYKANIAALKEVGVKEVVAIYAVGSISDKLKPNEIGLIDQFIDFSFRSDSTFHLSEQSTIGHTLFDQPFSKVLNERLMKVSKELKIELKEGGVYICTNGPRLETASEIKMFKSWGSDYVGMTASTETILANEIGLTFSGIAHSINWATGITDGAVDFVDSISRSAKVAQIIQIIEKAFN